MESTKILIQSSPKKQRMLRKILITQEPEEQGKTKKKLQPRTASAVSPVESGPEERPDEAEAASQEAAERAPPAPAAAAGIPPRGRRHLQVRVRRVLHQRVPDHVYVPATAAAAADDAAGRGRAARGRGVLRRRQDVPEAGVPVPAAAAAVAVVVAPGAVGDIDHRRRPRRRRALLGRAPVPQLEVAGGRAVGERRARPAGLLRRRRKLRQLRRHDGWRRRHSRSDRRVVRTESNSELGRRRRRLARDREWEGGEEFFLHGCDI